MAVLRFVDSIQSSPGVRLNLNDGAIWVMGEETTFGIPPMRRSVSSSMIRDGDFVGATSYGNRELNLVLELRSANADTAATQLQALQRELDRPQNWLQYTPGSVTNTVFFRTFRASPESVRWSLDRKRIEVTVLAEPFALGLREDLSPITINNNPAAGSNGLFCDLTGIKGDVETPLFIEYTDGAAGLARSGFSIGVRSGPSPYPNRFIQAESMGMLTDTSAVVDAAMSGGSKARVTFATAQSLATRLSNDFPAASDPAGAENWGVYRVFARVAQTVAGDSIQMTVRTGAGSNNPAISLKQQIQPQLVDLGTLDSTIGLPTSGGYAAADYRIENQAAIFVSAGRTSGSGSLDIDYIAYVPADECYGAWTAFTDVAATTDLGVVDGIWDAAFIATALSGGTPGRNAINSSSIVGRLPRVMPGNNRLVIVESSKTQSPPNNTLTTSISMTIRYWPRYLLVRPVST